MLGPTLLGMPPPGTPCRWDVLHPCTYLRPRSQGSPPTHSTASQAPAHLAHRAGEPRRLGAQLRVHSRAAVALDHVKGKPEEEELEDAQLDVAAARGVGHHRAARILRPPLQLGAPGGRGQQHLRETRTGTRGVLWKESRALG